MESAFEKWVETEGIDLYEFEGKLAQMAWDAALEEVFNKLDGMAVLAEDGMYGGIAVTALRDAQLMVRELKEQK